MAEGTRFVTIAVDPAVPGMSRLADAWRAEPFLPGRRALRDQIAMARQKGHQIAVVLPSTRVDLVLFAHFAPVDRIALYYPGPHNVRAPALGKLRTAGHRSLAEAGAGLRAAFAVVDMTIVPRASSMADAVRAGADPERVAPVQDVLPRLFDEPPRRSMASGAVEMAASLALDGAEAVGVVGLFERMTNQRGVNVVNYHRVLPIEEVRRYWRPQMAISSEVFEAQLEAFAKCRGFTPPERIGSTDSRGRVALTFDDGYEDNFRVALPILQRFSAPACIYLVTELIGQKDALWWDRVGLGLYAWWRSGAQGELPSVFPHPAPRLAALTSLAEARTCITDILSGLNQVSEEKRNRAVECAEALVGQLGGGARTMLGWDEVQRMSECGVRFGSHTRSHIPLDEMPREAARRELLGGQADLEARLDGGALKSAALPRGRLGELTVADLEEGFETIMTTEAGVHRPDRDGLFVKRRDGRMLTLRGRHHPAKLRLELTGVLDSVRQWARRVSI